MVIAQELKNTDLNSNSYLITAFADTKDEVTSSVQIVGLPDNAEIETGSTLITADGDVAFYKSDKTWNWVE